MENIAQEQQPQEKKTQKKKPIKVDMTPMVDLGFLLITFFMFTTQFTKPNVMDLGLPAKDINTPLVNDIDRLNQITFILGENNKVFYHQSSEEELTTSNLMETTFDGLNIPKIINTAKKNAPKPEIFTVIIKPTEKANYKNFVDVLDNLAITQNERYGVTDIRPWEEKIYLQKLK